MTTLVDRLLPLWAQPLPDGPAAEARFAEVYADPVTVNGASLTIADLVERARALQGAFTALEMRLVDQVETAGKLAIAFVLRGRHVGPYPTALGTVAPTGRQVEVRTIDVLTVTDGRISAIWVVSDELGMLSQLGALEFTG
jgi:predicted ester cyclase